LDRQLRFGNPGAGERLFTAHNPLIVPQIASLPETAPARHAVNAVILRGVPPLRNGSGQRSGRVLIGMS
jgi:hypothetical protein